MIFQDEVNIDLNLLFLFILIKLLFIFNLRSINLNLMKNKGFYMNIEYIKENYKFETLTEEHDLSQFESDSKDLNDFLKNDALKQQNSKLNLTKLIVCDGKIIGFASLLTDTISLKDVRDDIVVKDIKNQLNYTSKKNRMPAIKIGRFAIDKRYSGQGLGSDILMNILFNLNLPAV